MSEAGAGRRFRHGLVLGKFYPFHSGHQAVIRTAQRACERLTIEILGASVETIPLDVRVSWLREEHPTARVVGAIDDAPIDFDDADIWDLHMPIIEELLDEPVDAVFTSEPYGIELARRLDAARVHVDPGRLTNPVSGTAIRDDLIGNWAELPPSVRAWFTQRVVVLGAESTGSTTLAMALAESFATEWVPEYGRTYSVLRPGGPNRPWRSDEFDLVVDRQIESETHARRRTPIPLLVCDTDALATTIWHERYVGPCPEHLVERAAQHRPLAYVLTGDDIPFVQDGLRDGEHLRRAMQQRFREVLAAQSVPWIEVHGRVDHRAAEVRAFVEPLLATALRIGPSLEEIQTRA
ncbi:AAA family ATPase [Antrihabitans sp. YC3-6]|uniref:AAA family ATPase n=1 Tax=Antrihabitans stalagmiti TaxID=2799499 RepID=A0A934U0K3_9NOCA|nr:AAA family ATPase [Antrihabitans stalagmiti]MBJ8337576.1 AAA family ATPase [Antrihabitans stalagmiti]